MLNFLLEAQGILILSQHVISLPHAIGHGKTITLVMLFSDGGYTCNLDPIPFKHADLSPMMSLHKTPQYTADSKPQIMCLVQHHHNEVATIDNWLQAALNYDQASIIMNSANSKQVIHQLPFDVYHRAY